MLDVLKQGTMYSKVKAFTVINEATEITNSESGTDQRAFVFA